MMTSTRGTIQNSFSLLWEGRAVFLGEDCDIPMRGLDTKLEFLR